MGYFERERGASRAGKEGTGEREDLSEPQGPGVGSIERESQKVRDN